MVAHRNQSVCMRGVTLVELVLVILILSLASVVVLGLFSQASRGWFVDEDVQIAAQLAQERAEQVLATRRSAGYGAVSVGTVNDTLTGAYSVYTRSVTVTTVSGSPCPNATCKQVSVTVNRGASSLANITFQVVDY